MKKILLFFIFTITLTVNAQEIQFEASTDKSTYALDEKIRVSFRINTDGDNFEPPTFEGFKVEGPQIFKGNSESVTVVNGRVTTKRSIYTENNFFLTPKAKGTFTIQAAKIDYKGKKYYSKPITIEITDSRTNSNPNASNNDSRLVGNGVFLIAETDKKTAYVNEVVSVIYKIYFDPTTSITNVFVNKAPTFNNFWSQFESNNNPRPYLEVYDGKEYGVIEFRKALLIPLKAGNQTLEPLTLNLDLKIENPNAGFFNNRYSIINQNITCRPKKIEVKALPENNKPAQFTNAVGTFELNVIPNKKQIKFGESLDLKVELIGKGNLNLINLPRVENTPELEIFEPKHQENITSSVATGMIGNTADIYTIVPQLKGKMTLKPITFSYFDTETNQYKTIISDPITIDVLDGPGLSSVASNDQEELKKIKTFQFINTTTAFESKNKSNPFGSPLYYALLVMPLCFIPLAFVIKRKKEAVQEDVVGLKLKSKDKLAKKYLSEAKGALGNASSFYLSIEKALHNFLKAKLNIETSEMDKENIRELLIQKQATSETINAFIDLMKSAEFARYAPSSNHSMQTDFDKAVNVITDLEKQLKK
jgi:hypothetical protein